MVKIDLSSFLDGQVDGKTKKIFDAHQNKVNELDSTIKNRTCKGSEMLGWLDYPFKYNENEINEIIEVANEWRSSNIKKIVMLGIGGSYIGVRAGIDLALPEFGRDKEIIYVSSLSSSYITSLVNQLKNEDFYLIVISKSGTTLEIGIAYRVFYNLLLQSVGSDEAQKRTVFITDSKKGVLRKITNDYPNIKAFSIPDDVGGRFSAITPIGLFPMAVMGLDIKQVLKGCQQALIDSADGNLENNTAYQYAVLRHWQYAANKKTSEVFCVYENGLRYLTEHWKQLFAESEGKDGKGLYPTNCLFTTDLHSVGQFLQDGKKHFFETCLSVKQPLIDSNIVENFLDDVDGLQFVGGKSIDYVNKVAASSTVDAHHIEGGVDIIKLEVEKRDAFTFGYLYSWFSKALALSALLLDVNPFNQPGVEAYKKRMFASLKK